MWYAGIDWADEHHDVVVVDQTGHKVQQFRVRHTKKGLAEMCHRLLEVVQTDRVTRNGEEMVDGTPDTEQIACVVETNRGLLITALMDAGFPVFPVNPRTVKARSDPAGPKTDARDAYTLAKTGRADYADLRRLTPDSPLVRELKILTRDQDTLIHQQTRLVNGLKACLKEYYPVVLELFVKLQQPLTVAFLRKYPRLEKAQAETVDELTAFMEIHSPHYGTPTPRRKAEAIWERVHGPQLVADAATVRGKSRYMLALVDQLTTVMEQIATYDREIAELFKQHPDHHIFKSLPGAGARLAPRLLAEWGDDRARYAKAASIQALAGTAPKPRESGNYSRPRMRMACIKPLRNAFHQFAWETTQCEEWAKAYYKRKRQEEKNITQAGALRKLANHWVRIIYAMWMTRTPYDASIFLAAKQAHGPRAA